MSHPALNPRAAQETQQIVVDEVFHASPEKIWKALTETSLMARWIMAPAGFAAVKGTRFTFQTKPAGAWDGTISCEVLEAVPNERLSYSWKSGDAGNVGYGAPLDTVVTFTLTKVEIGTRLRLVHAGFILPKNETAYTSMGEGWKKCFPKLDTVTHGEP